MIKEFETLKSIKRKYIQAISKTKFPRFTEYEKKQFNIIETALKAQEENDFELQVFKLAYEWKCNGVDGTYEKVLDQARKTVEGWKEIERKGYGTIITD